MKEIIYPKYEDSKPSAGIICQVCRSDLFYDTIPCPEGKIGCLVLHYGFRCKGCGRIFQ